MKMKLKELNNPLLKEVVKRVVDAAHPEKIILFGSKTKGRSNRRSDFDLLVIKANVHRRRMAQSIYRRLLGLECPVDVIVVTPDDVQQYRNDHCLVIKPALDEGKIVYEKKTISA